MRRALLLALLVTAPHAARGDLNFVIGCLAERGCPGAQFANYGSAALNQAGAGTVTVAHFLSGAIGKWSTQEVYEAYLGYVRRQQRTKPQRTSQSLDCPALSL